jgi:integrase
MPRPRREDRWTHPLYNIGFCRERDGMVHTEIKGQRLATGLVWHDKNKKLALQILEQRILAHLNPAPLQNNTPKLHTTNSAFELFAKQQFPTRSKSYLYNWKQAVEVLLPSNILITATEEIRSYMIERLAKSHLHANTKRQHLACMQQFFEYCIEEHYCSRSPVKKSMYPKKVKQDVKPFTMEEYERIVEYFETKPPSAKARLDKNRDKKQFVLLLKFVGTTAVRINEALGIHWSDISEDFILIHGKGARDRKFPLKSFPEVREIVRQCEEYREANKGKLFVWTSYAKLELWIRQALEALEIPGDGRNFHSIRKMRENYWIKQERLPSDVVAAIVGHTTRVQSEHYLQALEIQEMDAIISYSRVLITS